MMLLLMIVMSAAVEVSYKEMCDCSKFVSDTVCFDEVNCVWKDSLC